MGVGEGLLFIAEMKKITLFVSFFFFETEPIPATNSDCLGEWKLLACLSDGIYYWRMV